jgi:tagaturonate reductase
MYTLTRSFVIKNNKKIQETLKAGPVNRLPVKVLQFGQGNFLRGFMDWMFNRLNSKGLFMGSIAVVESVGRGRSDIINEQEGLYTLLLRGMRGGEAVQEAELITAIDSAINICSDFAQYLRLAENPDLRVIVSNTTEAGIAYDPSDRFGQTPPASFPGKLTIFLHARYSCFKGDPSKGFIILPCELIEQNGDRLKAIVLRLAEEWKLGMDFIKWIHSANFFLNTLVDRIISGYPTAEAEELEKYFGYNDRLLVTGELYHLLVIEGDERFRGELPFDKAGLNVVWTDDLTPYRTRKVRILNGAHTMSAPAAYLYGMDTVRECTEDELIRAYINKGVFDEIIPALDLPENELTRFAACVMERFANPYIQHKLLSISLNSISKFGARILPSLLRYNHIRGKLPQILTFSMAALFTLYNGSRIDGNALVCSRDGNEYIVLDDMHVLEAFKEAWKGFDGTGQSIGEITSSLLGKKDWWGMDLNEVKGLAQAVSGYMLDIYSNGIGETIKGILA